MMYAGDDYWFRQRYEDALFAQMSEGGDIMASDPKHGDNDQADDKQGNDDYDPKHAK